MTEPIQARISEFWNTVAQHYEGHPGNTVPVGSPTYERWVGLFERVLPSPPVDVLDVGTGTGFSALISAALGHRVVGVDLAAGMLDVARAFAKDRGLDVQFVEADAVAPEFDDASFDVITARHLLWTLRDVDEAAANWRRLLRPLGRVVAVDGFRPRPQPADAPASEEDVFGRYYTSDVQAAISFMHVQDKDPLVRVFGNAGFSDVIVEELPHEFAEDDEEDVRPYLLVASA